jgi:hypothetical protein
MRFFYCEQSLELAGPLALTRAKELIGVVDMLQPLHVPYGVVMFGDSQLFSTCRFRVRHP